MKYKIKHSAKQWTLKTIHVNVIKSISLTTKYEKNNIKKVDRKSKKKWYSIQCTNGK